MENQIKRQQELLSSSRGQGQESAETIRRIENAVRDLPAAALPVTPARAVTVTQSAAPSTTTEAQGYAVLHVIRPVDNVTGRINLVPEFAALPGRVVVRLDNVPLGLNVNQFTLRAGTASVRGFAIHLTANEADLVPSGDYRIIYEARVQGDIDQNGPPQQN